MDRSNVSRLTRFQDAETRVFDMMEDGGLGFDILENSQ